MNLNATTCYQALLTRDRRFDGVFFTGVTTTGIYCRPVCPARTPRRDRCRFFIHAAAAEHAGFRPCLRCRPELAPGFAPMDASGRVAQAVAARIEAGALNHRGGLETLAHAIGLSSRQVRRVVRQELGVTPVELAQTHRLLLAKQLLTDTRLPITQVAHGSGFASLRRFNALFRARYGMAPSRVRRQRHEAGTDQHITLMLEYRPPFSWPELMRYLADRATAGVEWVSGQRYARTVALGTYRGWLQAWPLPERNLLAIKLAPTLIHVLPEVLARVRRLFDLNARPDLIASQLQGCSRLKILLEKCPGLRVPGAFDGFELAVRAILGQQVSIRAATTLAGRFAAVFGEPVETPFGPLTRLSPTPQRVTALAPAQLTALGITAKRAKSILALAQAVADGELCLQPGPDPDITMQRLRGMPGIGPWTAQYIALRGLHWPDAFPASDLGLLKAWGTCSAPELQQAADAWRPWRGYAAMHLWNSLSIPAEESKHA